MQYRGIVEVQAKPLESRKNVLADNSTKGSISVLILAIGIACVALIVDIVFPLGVAGGIVQIFPVLIGIWVANKRWFIAIAALAIMFVIAGYYLSPSGGVFWVVLLNRILSVIAILACATIAFYAFYSGHNKEKSDIHKRKAITLPGSVFNIFGPGILVAGLFSLLLVVSVMFYISREAKKSEQWVAHTQNVQTHISKTLSLMQDLETGQRGYLLTGEKQYLQPFNVAITHVDEELGNLKKLVSDNPNQQKRSEVLSGLIAKKISELRNTISLRDTEGLASALVIVKSDLGKNIMDRIRQVLAEMEEEENRLLILRKASSQQFNHYALIVNSLAIFLIILVGVIIVHRVRAFVVFRDQTETRLRQLKEEAEAANQAKSSFLSAMSHELRTPLNAILGFGRLLDSPDNPLDESRRQSVNHILESGDHLLTLINEILDLAKIESGSMEFSIEPVSLRSVVQPCVTMTQSLAERYGIRIEDRVPADSTLFVLADLIRVRQVLINLLSNAVKYNRPDGLVVLDASEQNDWVRISVTDTGYGIPHDKFDDIFKPFDRLDGKNRAVEGTGIGLTITRELVDKMDGRMGLESVVDEGTTFWFELPLTEEVDITGSDTEETPSAAETYRKVLKKPLTRKRVVYIEDNPANINLMKLIFSKVDNVVLQSYESAEEGIEGIVRNPPDLILMDINLPGISGIEATRVLKKNNMTRHVPVLGVSANAMPHDAEKAAQAGIDGYIIKPFKIDEIVEIVLQRLGTLDEVADHSNTANNAGEFNSLDDITGILSEEVVNSIYNTSKTLPSYSKILKDMYRAIPEICSELQTGLESRDASVVERAAHRIKTNAATLGAMELSAVAQKTETMAAEGQWSEVEYCADVIESEYQKIEKAVHGLFAALQVIRQAVMQDQEKNNKVI